MAHTIRIRKDTFAKGYYSVHDVTMKDGKLLSEFLVEIAKDKKDAKRIRELYKAGQLSNRMGSLYKK